MADELSLRSNVMAAFMCMLAIACLTILLVSPQAANAEASNYCSNQTLGNHGACWGAVRVVQQTYGWGDQHSVCVWTSYGEPGGPFGGFGCSSGPGVGVYSPRLWEPIGNMYPAIENNAAGNNLVHGVSFSN
jgi:hypothetical protein